MFIEYPTLYCDCCGPCARQLHLEESEGQVRYRCGDCNRTILASEIPLRTFEPTGKDEEAED